MSIKAVLFDLDGTLLPMKQEEFVKAYFGLLSKRLANFGYDPKELVSAIWAGTKDMMKNTGENTNEEVFWKRLTEVLGERCIADQKLFDDYYHNEYHAVRDVCGFNPKAAESVKKIKSSGYRVALATQPIFPSIATETRLSWAGLDISDFEVYTSYENISFCKPNPEYYKEVARRMGVSPEECLMVGNDVSDDMVAEKLGMKVFLLTDCLINNENADISQYPHGNFDELLSYLNLK
ncbi:MAG: HAD family hydrolase [Clostridia bacterium]|nr:HAD family hydrolase [Clostridia bacterium]